MRIDAPFCMHYNVCKKGRCKVISIDIANFKKIVFQIAKRVIKCNEPVNITAKTGNVGLLSEDVYHGIDAPLDECILENAIEW